MKDLHRDEKMKEYYEGLKGLFPDLRTGRVYSAYSGDFPTSATIHFGNTAQVVNSVFSDPKQKYFVHYTSINSLVEILRTGVFRLYDLNNLNDPEELKVDLNGLEAIDHKELLSLRKSYFVGSFCSYDNENQDDDFVMWQLYGNNGNGVGIVFELQNSYKDWTSAYFGAVKYSNDTTEFYRMVEFYNYHKDFNEEYNLFENLPSIFRSFALFFKKENWMYEQEYRLFTKVNYNPSTFRVWKTEDGTSWLDEKLKITILKNGKQGAFIEYPLNFSNLKYNSTAELDSDLVSSYKNSIPSLMPVKIIAGYNLSTAAKEELYKVISHLSLAQFGIRIPVIYSRFSGAYK